MITVMGSTIQCWIGYSGDDAQGQLHNFVPDEQKKSVFWLGEDPKVKNNSTKNINQLPAKTEANAIATREESTDSPNLPGIFSARDPAEAIISSSVVWAVGGFQLTSNAQNVKVFLTSKEKEDYLTTVKGLPSGSDFDNQKMFKALCVIPGGVRPVSRIRLVFENLENSGRTQDDSCGNESKLKLHWIKLTARLVVQSVDQNTQTLANQDNSSMATQSLFGNSKLSFTPLSKTAPPAQNRNSMADAVKLMGNFEAAKAAIDGNINNRSSMMSSKQQPDTNGEPLATVSDLSASMAGLNFSLRSTEDRILKRIEISQATFQQQLIQQQQQYIGYLNTVIQQQQAWIDKRLEQQDTLIQEAINKRCYAVSNGFGASDHGTSDESARQPPLWQRYAGLRLGRPDA